MSSPSIVKGFLALLRLPYWMMTGGLAILTSFAILAINKNPLSIEITLLTFLSMALVASAGFAINDFFDKESDAIIKPKRPIPSGALSQKQVTIIAACLFIIGLILASQINLVSFIILLADSLLLIIYSALVKRKSGFAANLLMGILTGTAFLYGEAALYNQVTLISLSLYPIAFGTIGGNVLRDILSLEGDTKVGYPTLPQKIGNPNTARVGAFFFIICGVFAPLPYFIAGFSFYYLVPILLWSALLIYSSVRLITCEPIAVNVRKYERIVTMSMILLPLALILQAITAIIRRGYMTKTKSICPICQKKIDATLFERDGKVVMVKHCKEHGDFTITHWQSPVVYNFTDEYDYFKYFEDPNSPRNPKGCPEGCPTCTSHVSDTVIGVIDVTKKCDLRCPVCFSTFNDHIVEYEPTKDDLIQMLTFLSERNPKPPAILFSGGEPMQRDDLPEIIAVAHKLKFMTILATNGLRLSND
ncbi:MAG: UbiA family prenyltransferase, partial [Crenarchaeota archaeon]|nr:UbiA family prenyltransferase [Thermoproteota archaeon]